MKVAFLDRDGVINVDLGYLHRVEDFMYTEGCIDALRVISDRGFGIVIVTNQAGIAHGYYTESDFHKLMKWLIADLNSHGIKILDYFFCPHHPQGKVPKYSKLCDWRKPSPGMILHAVNKYSIDIAKSFLVGDKETDLEAAKLAGLAKYFLVRGGEKALKEIANFEKVYKDIRTLVLSGDCFVDET